MSPRDLEQDSARLNRIAVISHADFDHDTAQGIGARPVLDHTGDEFGVRNDDARPVKRLDLGCANTNAPHPSFFPLDHDRVADADRPLGQQNETGYEVGHDGLQAKTDADGEGAGNQGDLRSDDTVDEFGVRNDDARPVKRLDLGCANTNAPHPSFFPLDHDRVADADRPLGQQNETGYEVGHDGLQAKTDADGEGAGNQGDL